MLIVLNPYVHQAKINKAVAEAGDALKPDVVRIRYSFDEDWSGSPAVFFKVVLSDEASHIDRLGEAAERVRTTVLDDLKPYELGLEAYFNFRSASEQAELQEEAWS
jgi:hypothetical protein